MKTPLIGLTTYNQTNKSNFPIAALMHKYIDAIAEAGGAPLLIPSGLQAEALETIFDRLDGVLFTGGGDVAIERYGGQSHPDVSGVDPARDAVEIELVRLAVARGKPFLGICRGIQVVNVALGGTLYTHIPDQRSGALKHNYDSGSQREYLAHRVQIEPESRMAEIFGVTDFEVNSLHHQGILQSAPGLKPVGYAPDGLIEAAELRGHVFGMAVQWHPEWLTAYEHARRLFRAFVEAAGGKTR